LIVGRTSRTNDVYFCKRASLSNPTINKPTNLLTCVSRFPHLPPGQNSTQRHTTLPFLALFIFTPHRFYQHHLHTYPHIFLLSSSSSLPPSTDAYAATVISDVTTNVHLPLFLRLHGKPFHLLPPVHRYLTILH
jgi:hypothetical protein